MVGEMHGLEDGGRMREWPPQWVHWRFTGRRCGLDLWLVDVEVEGGGGGWINQYPAGYLIDAGSWHGGVGWTDLFRWGAILQRGRVAARWHGLGGSAVYVL